MNPLALLNWRLWAGLALAVALAASYWKAYTMGKSTVQAKWDAQSLEVAKQSLKLSEQTTRTTTNLQAAVDTIEVTKNAQIDQLNVTVASLSSELRKRPQRPNGGNLPNDPGVGKTASGCTGAGLFGQDAEFLVGEAATAARLRIALKACYSQYDQARGAINGKAP